MDIHSLDELLDRLGGIWKYLTDSWVSLKHNDDLNVTRRTVHPFWRCSESWKRLRRDD